MIGVTHGKNLVSVYEKHNPYKNKATVKYPAHMTHNLFDLNDDIS